MIEVYSETLPGWKKLWEPLVREVAAIGGEVDQIKEKFGGLRFYYSVPSGTPKPVWSNLQQLVQEAETQSYTICEVCGEPGTLHRRSNGYWLKTLCAQDAKDYGYSPVNLPTEKEPN